MSTYSDALILEERIQEDAAEASRLAWMLSGAVRAVRHSKTPGERADAELHLAGVLDAVWPGWQRRLWAETGSWSMSP